MREVVQLVQREIERLRIDVERLQREGDLINASELLYEQIPRLEESSRLLEATSIAMHSSSSHHALVTLGDDRTWVCFPVEDLDPATKRAKQMHCEDQWHIAVDEALDPAERRELVLQRARAALRAGDGVLASRLEADALPLIEAWIDQHRVFTLVDTREDRMVLSDSDGTIWIAARAADIT